MFNKIAIVLLLVGLAGLATVAKDGQYYPSANPARQVSLATKMNLDHTPVVLSDTPLEKVARIIVAKPRPIIRRTVEPEVLLTETVSVTVSLQLRSPPRILS